MEGGGNRRWRSHSWREQADTHLSDGEGEREEQRGRDGWWDENFIFKNKEIQTEFQTQTEPQFFLLYLNVFCLASGILSVCFACTHGVFYTSVFFHLCVV